MSTSPRYHTPGVYVQELSLGSNAIPSVPTAVTAFVGRAARGHVNMPIPIGSFGEFQEQFGGRRSNTSLSSAVHDYFTNGGSKAIIVRIADGGRDPGSDLLAGIKALEQTNIFNLLCIPPVADDDVPLEVWQAAADYCQQRRAFLIVDPPQSWRDAKAAIAGREKMITSANAALYFPRLRRTRSDFLAPGGAVAGVYARTDAQQGVWKAPAGVEAVLKGIDGLTVTLSDAELQTLNPLNINCLRTIDSIGHVIWGARTMAGDDGEESIWKYVSVRRLFLFIEESVDRGTSWTVFEPNNEPLWAKLRQSITAFMDDLFRKGAFQGASAQDAYFVKCDNTTTSESDIEQGKVNILIGFAPLRPAEFVILKIQQDAGT
jgi:phage tail sheath protein FI